MSINQILMRLHQKKMSDLQKLSLVLYIFLVTETYDSNSSKKCETPFEDFLKSFFGDKGEIVEVCKEYITKIITKIIEEAKGREGEIVKVYEEDITKIIVKVCKEYITKVIEEAKDREGEIVKVCEEDITKIIVKVCKEYIITKIIVKVCKEYIITKIIEEAKSRKGEIVKVCEEDRVYTYLTYSNDNLAVIELYYNIKTDELNSRIDELNSRINSTRQKCLSNNNPFSGYALLTSATISSKHECNAEEIASKIILNIYNSNINHNTRISSIDSPNKLTEQSIKTKIGSVDLPTRSTTKQFIKLFGLTYDRKENTLYRSLILYSDRSKEFTDSYSTKLYLKF
jgi:hypothetical protein